jgi:hypothetical protein
MRLGYFAHSAQYNNEEVILMSKHLREFTLQELEATVCLTDGCDNNMAEEACPNCIKDNEAICVDHCGCWEEEYS